MFKKRVKGEGRYVRKNQIQSTQKVNHKLIQCLSIRFVTKFCKKLIVSSSFIPASAVNSQLLDKLHNHLDSVFFCHQSIHETCGDCNSFYIERKQKKNCTS